MISSEDLRFFNVLAKSVSLAEAARKMDVTPPAVTQRLRALEERIGIRLIDRSGRRMTLTDEGALVASHGTIVAEAMEALSEALANRKKAVSGHLRIVAPHGFGRLHDGEDLELAPEGSGGSLFGKERALDLSGSFHLPSDALQRFPAAVALALRIVIEVSSPQNIRGRTGDDRKYRIQQDAPRERP